MGIYARIYIDDRHDFAVISLMTTIESADSLDRVKGLYVFSHSQKSSTEERLETERKILAALMDRLLVAEVMGFFPMDHGIQVGGKIVGNTNLGRIIHHTQEKISGFSAKKFLGEITIAPRVNAEGGLYVNINNSQIVLAGARNPLTDNLFISEGYDIIHDKIVNKWAEAKSRCKSETYIRDHIDLFIFGAVDRTTNIPTIWIPDELATALETNKKESELKRRELMQAIVIKTYPEALVNKGIANIMWVGSTALTVKAILDDSRAEEMLEFLITNSKSVITLPNSQYSRRGGVKCRSLSLDFLRK